MLTVVVLPAPLGPSSATMLPAGTEKLTSFTARVSLKLFWRLFTSIASARADVASSTPPTSPIAEFVCTAPFCWRGSPAPA